MACSGCRRRPNTVRWRCRRTGSRRHNSTLPFATRDGPPPSSRPPIPSKLPPAVVLDLDETVLDNSAFEARRISNGVLFSEDEWNRWCEERSARPIPGAVEFLTHAQALGVKPIYITNRDHRVEQATRDVLAKIGVPLDATEDTILAPNENGWTAADKTVRRQFVSAEIPDSAHDRRQLRGLRARQRMRPFPTRRSSSRSTPTTGEESGSSCPTRSTDRGNRR